MASTKVKGKVKAYKAKYGDGIGNTYFIYVNETGRVSLCNQHRIALGLSNIAYAINPSPSYAEADRLVTTAARKGIKELRALTKINWVEFK